MEKRIWSKPEMNQVEFAANEYVSLCLKLTCTLMGDNDWYDVEQGHGGSGMGWDRGEHRGHHHDLADIHQKNQCGQPGWFNTTTKQESGSNGARIENVWLDYNGNGTFGDEGDIFADTASDDLLRQVTTTVSAIWDSIFQGMTWHHKGDAVFDEKNAANS